MKKDYDSIFEFTNELQKAINIAQSYASQPAFLAQQTYLSSLENSVGYQQSIIEQVMEASKAYNSMIDSIIQGPASLMASNIIPSVANTLGISSAIDVLGDICSKACDSSIQSILANKDYFELQEQLCKITNSFINPINTVDNSFLKSIDYDNEAFEKILEADQLSIEDVDYAIESNQITDEDLKNEVKEIIKGNGDESNTAQKKILSAIGKFIISALVSFFIFDVFLAPVTDAIKNKFIEELRVNEFWQGTGIIDLIENAEVNVYNSNSEREDKNTQNNELDTVDLESH